MNVVASKKGFAKEDETIIVCATYKLATESLDGMLVSIGRGPSEGFLMLVGIIAAFVIVATSLLVIRYRLILKQRC